MVTKKATLGAIPLKKALQNWMHQVGLDSSWEKFRIIAIWNQVAEDKVLKHTKPLRFHTNVLEISVDSPAIYFELVNFKKRFLVEKLRKNCLDDLGIFIEDIRFICSGRLQ